MITSQEELESVLEIYDKHARTSEAKINKDQMEILVIGDPRVELCEKKYQEMIQDRIKILGTIFTRKRSEVSGANITNTIEKIKKSFRKKRSQEMWNMGKVNMANTVIYLLLYHRAWVIECTGELYQKMQGKIASYLMPRKGRVIQTLATTRNKGGLGLIKIKKGYKPLK